MPVLTPHDRPKTDYERWLESQPDSSSSSSNSLTSGNQVQYHPPNPDLETDDTSSNDAGNRHGHAHGMFLHHTYHRQGAVGHGYGVRVDGSYTFVPGDYGVLVVKVVVLVLLVVGVLRVGRVLRGRRGWDRQVQI